MKSIPRWIAAGAAGCAVGLTLPVAATHEVESYRRLRRRALHQLQNVRGLLKAANALRNRASRRRIPCAGVRAAQGQEPAHRNR